MEGERERTLKRGSNMFLLIYFSFIVMYILSNKEL